MILKSLQMVVTLALGVIHYIYNVQKLETFGLMRRRLWLVRNKDWGYNVVLIALYSMVVSEFPYGQYP
jgi:hypothetical protein